MVKYEGDSTLTNQMKCVTREDLLLQLRHTEEIKKVACHFLFCGSPFIRGTFERLDDTVKANMDETVAPVPL